MHTRVHAHSVIIELACNNIEELFYDVLRLVHVFRIEWVKHMDAIATHHRDWIWETVLAQKGSDVLCESCRVGNFVARGWALRIGCAIYVD